VTGDQSNGHGHPEGARTPSGDLPLRVEGIGARLRGAREAQGRTLEECAAALKARPGQIQALESETFASFGGDIYVRGFLRSYGALLGLDTAELLAAYGRDPSFRAETLATVPGGGKRLRLDRSVPIWAAGLIGLVVVGAVTAGVVLLGGQRTPEVALPIDAPLAPPESAPAPVRPEPAPAPAPAPEPIRPPIELVLTLEGTSWLEVIIDDAAVEPGRTVRAGETLRFEAQESIAVRYGNAGGVRAEHNGVDLGPQGRPGEVVRVLYGPDGVISAP
jgi:transcriptional regulator with XRE-family HTH domain